MPSPSDTSRTPDSATHPLSPMQRHMLGASQRAPREDGVYLEQVLIHIPEEVSQALVRECWHQLTVIYPILRTTANGRSGEAPSPRLAPRVDIPYKFHDLHLLSDHLQKKRFQQILTNDRRKGFNPTKPPLMRLRLIKYAEDNYQLLWTVHHLLVDGRSITLLLEQFGQLYQAMAQGLTYHPPEAPEFSGYLAWISKNDQAEALQFWRSKVANFRNRLLIPLERRPLPTAANCPDPANEKSRYGKYHMELDMALTNRIRTFALQRRITVNTVIQGAWAILLSRYCRVRDVLFGAVKSVRHCPNASQESIGPLINGLPVRVKIPDQALLDEWLIELRRYWLEVRPFEHSPVLEWAAEGQLGAEARTIDTFLMYERTPPQEGLASRDPLWQSWRMELLERSPLPILLAAYGGPKLEFVLEYDGWRFREDLMVHVLEHLKTLMLSIISGHYVLVRDLPMLPEKERAEIIEHLQPPTLATEVKETVHNRFRQVARVHGPRPALVYQERQLTYEQLDQLSDILVSLLGSRQEKKVIAICLPRSFGRIISLIAVLKSGSAFLLLDPAYPAQRLNRILEQADPDLLITDADLLPFFGDHDLQHLLFDLKALEGKASTYQAAPPSCGLPSTTAYILFTSGSSGEPKGVTIEHHSLLTMAENSIELYETIPEDRILHMASPSFDTAMEEIFITLLSGASLVLQPHGMLDSVNIFLKHCRRLKLTVLDLPTAFWHLLAEECHTGALPEPVRLVIIGGEQARADKLRLWHRKIGSGVRLVNTYGPTETTVFICQQELTRLNPCQQVPIGLPMPKTDVHILDHLGRMVPKGVVGELHVAGPQLARGYLGQNELTEQSFITYPPCLNPEVPSRVRLYKTGDLAVFEDRTLRYLGRKDRQIKIRGFRVEPAEIESLLATHPLVKLAAVRSWQEPDGAPRLAAYVVVRQHEKPRKISQVLREWMKSQVPAYLRPNAIMVLDTLPYTANNKLDYAALPKPVHSAGGKRQGPANQIEADLIMIFHRLLGVDDITPDDSFFDLGGHSLLAIQLLDSINKIFKCQLLLESVYKSPSIRELAVLIDLQESSRPDRQLAEINANGDRPPFFCIHGDDANFYLPAYLGADQPFYAFFHQARDGRAMQHPTYPEMAAHYLEQIQEVQPKGPYWLGGYSAGGLIAYELACLLKARGEEVGILALFDTEAPGYRGEFLDGEHRYDFLKQEFIRISDPTAAASLSAPLASTFFKRLKGSIKRRFNRLLCQLYLAIGKTIPPEIRSVYIIKMYEAAEKIYHPSPYAGKIHLFRATINGPQNLEAGWQEYVQGEIEVHQVHGDHYSIVTEPHIRELGERLKEVLMDLPQADGDR